MSYIANHFTEAHKVLSQIDTQQIELMVDILAQTHQQGGRLFFLGVGGSAANASHAVNDFRKICGMEAYDGECDCRKPKPGMLVKASRDHKIDLIQSYMVGDRSKDIVAGKASGCRTIFIEYGYCEPLSNLPDFSTDNLQNAAKWILQQAPI